ncbi:MAG: TonB-dependent receptor [Gemmatimonadales bacterium]|nr:TonB-dependent receptor [Gemmatimonadales bacterium]
MSLPQRWKIVRVWIAVCLATAGVSGPLAAQSLTSGSLQGVVVGVDGGPLDGAQVTIETATGGAVGSFQTGFSGTFGINLLAAGEYRVLVEQAGYQPVRRIGIVVAPGQQTSISVVLERRPPPILAVEEQVERASPSGMARARLVSRIELTSHEARRDLSDVASGLSEFVAPVDGRAGLALSAGGLPGWRSRLIVDGVPETLLSHPGFPDQPALTPIFARDGLDQVSVLGAPVDLEWRGGLGTTIAAQTRRGGNRLLFQPYLSASSGALGARPLDNPADSTALSLRGGVFLSGPIVTDTASFALRFDFQSVETPSSYAWAQDAATYRGQAVSLREVLPAIAADSFGTQIGSLVAPPVRRWRGGSGSGRVDWRLGAAHEVAVRAGLAVWKEEAGLLGSELVSGAGSELSARDASAALTVTSRGTLISNELRVGFGLARREYGGTAVPSTTVVGSGAAFGRSLGLPALFDQKTFDISNAVQLRAGVHQIKVGGSASLIDYRQDYRYGASGAFLFGSVDGFGAGQGVFSQVVGPAEAASFTTAQLGAFLQDTWSVSPSLSILLGTRIDYFTLPTDKVNTNPVWEAITVAREEVYQNSVNISPRLGFVWQNAGDWVVRGGAGYSFAPLDRFAFAESILFDREVMVHRGVGGFDAWPALPGLSAAPIAGERLTLLNTTIRAPRTAKLDFGISRSLGDATLHLSGAYHHTDYLLRREDLNRLAAPVAATQEGRPVYGSLVKLGGLVAAVPEGNRRFTGFDLVSGLSPTGYATYYEFAARLEQRLSGRVALIASYTYSKTEDNLIGSRSADPTDQLNPFPDGLNGVDWAKGRSDFDVPHRGTALLRISTGGRSPLTLSGRYRVRSGLPFTPGFRPGVDVNADGSGNNDPAHLGTAVAGVDAALRNAGCEGGATGGFAVRNSCRETLHQAFDLSLSVGLPVGRLGDRLALTVDAFNLVATETGIVDRALVLVDPAGSIGSGGSGILTLPLVANPNFGSLLVRRGDPRSVRVGLRLEY